MTTKTRHYPNLPEVTVTRSQFECGPRATPLPLNDEELALLTTQEILALYREAWSWGFRCETVNNKNYVYLREAIEKRQVSLEEFEESLKKSR